MAVLVAGDEHLHEAEDGAPVGRRLEVEGRAEEEERERGDHEHDGHGEADDPAPGLLDVDDDGGREHDGEAQHRVVPVEEGLQRPPPPPPLGSRRTEQMDLDGGVYTSIREKYEELYPAGGPQE